MIQRVQSLYLLASSIVMLLFIKDPIAQIELPDKIFLLFYHNRIEPLGEGVLPVISTWPVTLLLLIIIGICLFTFFQFKNRIKQIRLCVFNIILHFGLVGLVYFFTKYTMNQEGGINSVFLWPIVLPFISIILIYLALKKIQKDELLVMSINRIR